MSKAYFDLTISKMTVKDGKAVVDPKPLFSETVLSPRGEGYAASEQLESMGIESGVFHVATFNPRNGNQTTRVVNVRKEVTTKPVAPDNVVAAINMAETAAKLGPRK